MGRYLLAFALLLALGASPTDSGAESMRRKLDSLNSGHARPGSVVGFTSAEINAWARHELPAIVPEGVRQPRVELASGAATGYALVDFVKLRHAQGQESNWLVRKLIEGEKPVKATARIQSAHGQATVFLAVNRNKRCWDFQEGVASALPDAGGSCNSSGVKKMRF